MRLIIALVIAAHEGKTHRVSERAPIHDVWLKYCQK
jgi:hypothetical protein